MIDELTQKEFEIIVALPRKFSDTDRACLAAAGERGMILATDDEDLLQEARKRRIVTFETENILEDAARTIGPKRAKEVLADIIKSGADKEFRGLSV